MVPRSVFFYCVDGARVISFFTEKCMPRTEIKLARLGTRREIPRVKRSPIFAVCIFLLLRSHPRTHIQRSHARALDQQQVSVENRFMAIGGVHIYIYIFMRAMR
jgi:hypothetical protein